MSPQPDSFLENYIRVDDPDAPIYRIIPLWFFEEALRLRQLVLVSPGRWEDPLEIVGDGIAVTTKRNGKHEQVIINQSLPPVFAQCWSSTLESDTLLRAYSRVVKDSHFGRNIVPKDEGIQVRTTPRKLLKALIDGTPSSRKGYWFLGSVMYLSRDLLLQEIANAIGQHGLNVFEIPSNRAKLLLLKREGFAHESEVRAIFVQQGSKPQGELMRIPFDPSAVFEEVTFDPRLATFERNEREMLIRSLGFKGTFRVSDLYQGIFMDVLIDNDTKPSDGRT